MRLRTAVCPWGAHALTRTARGLALAMLTLALPGCGTSEAAKSEEDAPTPEAPTPEAPAADAQAAPTVANWVEQTLTVGYGEYTLNGQKVKLRTYNGGLVGPTIRVRPGDVLRVTFKNTLPREEPAPCKSGHGAPSSEEVETTGVQPPPPAPCGFNTTNLHTHGLHVSPAGNADNVLIAVKPGDAFTYEYVIPRDHPSGTFWYHAHVHGSTSIQVGSGMAGALIVENNAADQRVLGAFDEKILLFQQIPYRCGNRTGATMWTCEPGEVGSVESFDLFAVGAWKRSGRPTTINGAVKPVYEIRPGEVQRWRLIHGGIRETIDFGIDKTTLPVERCAPPPPREEERLKTQPVAVAELARDGITMTELRRGTEVRLQPGYRSDVLMQVQEPGCYQIVDRQTDAEESLQAEAESRRVLGYLKVTGTPKPQTLPSPALIKAIARPTDKPAWGPVKQKVDFSIQLPDPNNACGRGKRDEVRFVVNDRYFDHDAPPRVLPLGATETWQVRSSRANHPFHVHVNHFLLEKDEVTGQPFRHWKDTAMVVGPSAPNTCETSFGPPLTLTTTYEDYIGQFVLHCHILDHEDQGMMQLVDIRTTEAHPTAHGHH